MTKEQIESNNHIPTTEIERDLLETESELKDYRDELEILQRHPQENKVRIYLLKGRCLIRQDFCDSLKEILEYRKCNMLAREE